MGEIWISRTIKLELDGETNLEENINFLESKKILIQAGKVYANALTLSDCFTSVYESAKIYLLTGK